MPAGEILRFGRAVGALAWMRFCFAQRTRCAAAMRRRAEAGVVRAGGALGALLLNEVRAWIAWSMRARSCRSSWMIPSMFDMGESVTSQFGLVGRRKGKLVSAQARSGEIENPNPAQKFWGAGEDRSMAPAF